VQQEGLALMECRRTRAITVWLDVFLNLDRRML